MNYDYIEETEGFTITLECLPEHTLPDWYFSSEEEKSKLLNDIYANNILWFCAKITAYKNNIPLAYNYLSGCCYRDLKTFINDDYYLDMKQTVIEEAKQTIKELLK